MNLAPTQKAFFLIALAQRAKEAEALFRFLPQAAAQEMRHLFTELSKHGGASIQTAAGHEVKKLARVTTRSYLTEVHPDWLADRLQLETPAMISVLLRYLPSEKINAILDRLPAEVLADMPKMAHTYAVDPILGVSLKRVFEQEYALEKTLTDLSKIQFDSLCVLSARHTEQIFKQIGYHEIALGLASLPERVRVSVIERLSPGDREHVEMYIARSQSTSPQRMKKAQGHLISQDISARAPEEFIKDLGFLIYAKAILVKDLPDLKIVKHKIDHGSAQDLQTMVDHHLANNTEAGTMEYREDVLAAMKHVLQKRNAA